MPTISFRFNLPGTSDGPRRFLLFYQCSVILMKIKNERIFIMSNMSIHATKLPYLPSVPKITAEELFRGDAMADAWFLTIHARKAILISII